ncbi:hypothetical protein HanPI659440_Chr17g0703381 [Helianthus annuus]|nr:hypothetical protein HanPI659440_Chr17g0703381 [Helianthus annuus]
MPINRNILHRFRSPITNYGQRRQEQRRRFRRQTVLLLRSNRSCTSLSNRSGASLRLTTLNSSGLTKRYVKDLFGMLNGSLVIWYDILKF